MIDEKNNKIELGRKVMIKEIMKYGKAELAYKNKQILSQKPELFNLFWETTLRCNAKCKHCGSRAGENINLQEELSTEEIKNVFQSIANKYDASKILISVTGGEPLIRQDLFEVMKFANQLGYHWGMTTNGILINDVVISKMKEAGMTTISISLDGLEQSHDAFRGVKSFGKIIENVKKLKEAKFLNYLQITTVVNKSNINELEEMYQKMAELGIDSWRILNMDPIGRAEDNQELALDKEDYIHLIKFIQEKRKKSKFDVTYGCTHFLGMKFENEVRNFSFFCMSGFTVGSILYNGDIYVCPSVERRKELIQGNIRTDDFVDVWENKFKWFRNLDKFKCKECENCKDWKYCRGDSLDTWDFNNNRPKLCLTKILEGDKTDE